MLLLSLKEVLKKALVLREITVYANTKVPS